MGMYALRTKGGDPRYPSEVIEADGYRRFARVLVFLREGREFYEVPTELVASVTKAGSRIDAEALLAGRPLAGTAPAAGRHLGPPADLPPLVPGPGTAPSRALTPTPLSAVLDLSRERVAIAPGPPHVESVEVRTVPRGTANPPDPAPAEPDDPTS